MVSGRPRSARTSRQSAIASRMLVSASSRLEPWLTQPGMAGHSEIQIPLATGSQQVKDRVKDGAQVGRA